MLRVAVVQLNSGDDVTANLERTADLLRQAAADGARLAVLPENFAAMGADDSYRVSLAEPEGAGPLQAFLSARSAELGLWLVGGTLPLRGRDPTRPYSACMVFDDRGHCRGRYDKMHLFDVDVPGSPESYRESAVTMPGQRPLRVDTPWGGLAVAVCYDLRFPEMFRYLSGTGISLLAIPAAFTYPTGRAHWQCLLRARAIENLCFVAAAAQAGVHPGGRRTYGHAQIVGPWGEVLAEAAEAPGIVVANLDLSAMAELRRRFPAPASGRFVIKEPT